MEWCMLGKQSFLSVVLHTSTTVLLLFFLRFDVVFFIANLANKLVASADHSTVPAQQCKQQHVGNQFNYQFLRV